MQLSHAITVDKTDAEYYRCGVSELILTKDSVRVIAPGDQLGVYSFRLHPEVAVAFARAIITAYDEGSLGA